MDFQAIEKAKQQWQTAADLMPQLICMLDGEGRVIHINRTMEWWGLGSVYGAKGRELHNILHPGCTEPDCYLQKFWQDTALARMGRRHVEEEAFDPIRMRHFHIWVQPLVWQLQSRSNLAEDLHTIVIVEDITDIKQAAAGLKQRYEEMAQRVAQEAEQRTLSEDIQSCLLAILEKTTDYVAIADASESLLYLNPAGRKILGLKQTDDISHMKLCDHLDPEVQKHVKEVAIPAAIENGFWTGESRMRNRRGREIYTSQVIIAHSDSNGQVDSFSTILRDITTRVRVEQALRESRDELRQLSGLLVSIQEEERRRIALDLHDGLGQSLSLIKLAVENASQQVAAGETDTALGLLSQISLHLKESLVDVRRVATELRPSILDDLGILPTLSWFFREFEAITSHISVEKILNIREEDVAAPLKITLYRIIQEAISNVVKHAAADRVRIRLYRDSNELHLMIEDNGRGFDPANMVCSHAEYACLGLASMKERVSLSGGNFRLASTPGSGTRIHASWPLEKAESAGR